MEDISIEIKKIEEQIENLPQGTLVYKMINGKLQPYLQQTVNGKTISTYIKQIGREKVLQDVKIRNSLMQKLKELKNQLIYRKINSELSNNANFFTNILIGKELKNVVDFVKNYKKRKCYDALNKYLYNDIYNKVFILYGLRRTGKTTLIKQAIFNMNEEDFSKTAFLQVNQKNTLAELNKDLILLRGRGYKYIFIDEITLLDDFIEGAALLPDIFVGEE